MSNDIKIRHDDIPNLIKSILESDFWLSSLNTMESYERLHDDHDGSHEGVLNVLFTPDADARIWITSAEGMQSDVLRFRMPDIGGGMSPRTRVALLILAEAIRADNESNPIS